jgi:hypothetical protein
MTPACMGGWCAVRDRCTYYQAQDRRYPIERLCEPKQHDAFEPVHHLIIPIKEAA